MKDYFVHESSCVGAGSVVTKDVPDYALVYGSPAKQHGWVCECGEKLEKDMRCPGCGSIYKETGGFLQKKVL